MYYRLIPREYQTFNIIPTPYLYVRDYLAQGRVSSWHVKRWNAIAAAF